LDWKGIWYSIRLDSVMVRSQKRGYIQMTVYLLTTLIDAIWYRCSLLYIRSYKDTMHQDSAYDCLHRTRIGHNLGKPTGLHDQRNPAMLANNRRTLFLRTITYNTTTYLDPAPDISRYPQKSSRTTSISDSEERNRSVNHGTSSRSPTVCIYQHKSSQKTRHIIWFWEGEC
jgi:hypothetical protein